jgi:hypothetical protein
VLPLSSPKQTQILVDGMDRPYSNPNTWGVVKRAKTCFPYEPDLPGRNRIPENTHPLACFLKLPSENEFIKYQINLLRRKQKIKQRSA